jgi:hypothetical protein
VTTRPVRRPELAELATVSELRQGGPPLRIEGLQELRGNRPAPSTEAVLADTETLFAARSCSTSS